MGIICSTCRDKDPKDGQAPLPTIISARSYGEINSYRDLNDFIAKNPGANLVINDRRYKIKLPTPNTTHDSSEIFNPLLNQSSLQKNEDQVNREVEDADSKVGDEEENEDEESFSEARNRKISPMIQVEFFDEENSRGISLPGFEKYNSHKGALQKNVAKHEKQDHSEFSPNLQREQRARLGRIYDIRTLGSSDNNSLQRMSNQMNQSKRIFQQHTYFDSKNKFLRREMEKQNQSQLHFAFLFASPLVMQINHKYEEDIMPEIGFQHEFEQIIQSLEQYQLEIKYKYQVATIQNLNDTLRQQPFGLHFSCHGQINDSTVISKIFGRNYSKEIKGLGDFLIFESRTVGLADFLFKSELSKTLSMYKSNLKFVVVASCHSEMIGEVFKKAGTEHVVCIQQKEQVLDKAASVFSRAFYINVIKSRLSICQAFENAKLLVEKSYNHREAEIFKLLTQDGHQCNQSFSILAEIPEGKIKCENKPPDLQILPANVSQWVPRDLETFEIIQKLCFDGAKIIEVFGYSGSGKSAITAKVVNYLAERNVFAGGIVYLNCTGLESSRDMINQMIQKIDFHFGKFLKQRQIFNDAQIIRQLLLKLQQYTNKHKVLLVFDNVESVVQKDAENFAKTFNSLVNERDKLQILFTTSIYVDKLERFVIKNLKKLNPSKAFSLFMNKIPSDEAKDQMLRQASLVNLITTTNLENNISRASELLKLGMVEIQNLQKISICQANCQPHKYNREKCAEILFQQHPIFKIISGPLSICLAASQLHHTSISLIYQKILDSSAVEDLDDTLLVNIVSAMQVANKEFDYAQEVIFVLSQTPSGLCRQDLEKIFNDKDDLLEALQYLQDTSLLTFDLNTNWYQVQNFIEKFIDEQLTENDLKVSYNMRLARYYVQFIQDMKTQMTQGSISIEDFIDIFSLFYQNLFQNLSRLRDSCFVNQEKDESKENDDEGLAAFDLALQKSKNCQRKESIEKFQALLAKEQNKEIIISKLSQSLKKMLEKKRQELLKNKKKLDKIPTLQEIDMLNLQIERLVNKTKSSNGPINLTREKSNLISTLDSNLNEILQDESQDDLSQSQTMALEDTNLNNLEEIDNENRQSYFNNNQSPIKDISISEFGNKLGKVINSKIKKMQADEKNRIEEDKGYSSCSTLKPPTLSKQRKHSILSNYSASEQTSPINMKNQQFNQDNKSNQDKLFSDAESRVDKFEVASQDKSYGLASINSALSQFIGNKLKKISDIVTENEKQKYKRTIARFKLFDNYDIPQSDDVMEREYFNLLRKESFDRLKVQPPLKSQTSINTSVWSGASYMMASPQMGPQNSLFKKQITANSIANVKQQIIYEQQDEEDKQSSEKSSAIAITNYNPLQSQQSISSYQSFAISKANFLGDFEKSDSNKQDDAFQDGTSQGRYRNIQSAQTAEEFQRQKENLIMTQYKDLLYEFLSIQVLSQIEAKDFQDLLNVFQVQRLDDQFQVNMDLLHAYIVSQQSETFEFQLFLKDLAKQFKKSNSKEALAIVNVIMANILMETNGLNNKQKKVFAEEAQEYLDQAEKNFQKTCNQDGLQHCNSLKKKFTQKFGRQGTHSGSRLKMNQDSKGFSPFIGQNYRKPISNLRDSGHGGFKRSYTKSFQEDMYLDVNKRPSKAEDDYIQYSDQEDEFNGYIDNGKSSNYILDREELILNFLLNRI